MGEAADDMLDGLCCEGCGEWFDDIHNGAEAPGHPRRCKRCSPAERPPPIACPHCTRWFGDARALAQHAAAKHGAAAVAGMTDTITVAKEARNP